MSEKSGFNINLESLIDLSTRLNQTFDDDFIINSALLSLMGKLRILRACFLVPCRKIDIEKVNELNIEDNTECYYNVKLVKGKSVAIKIPLFIPDGFSELNIYARGESILFNSGFRYVLPIVYQNCLKGLICLGPGYDNKPITNEERLYIRLVATITAGALNGSESDRSIIEAKNNAERRNQLLMSLFEISSEFNRIQSRKQIIKNLSYRLMGQLMVSRYAIYLQSNSKEFVPADSRLEKPLDSSIFKEFHHLENATTVESLELSTETKELLEGNAIRIISPMKHQGITKGYLVAGKKMNEEPYSEENFQFINALGNIAISALENERLFIEEIEKKRLEEEMLLAMNIQKNLLPKNIAPIAGYEIAGVNIPSFKVGGDYYDIIPLPGGMAMIVIADVSGKGAPAALLMANVQAALRVLAPMELEITDLMGKLNQLVFTNTTPDKFITLFLGILDPTKNIFTYINGGHNPPLHYHGGEFRALAEGGIILGVMEHPRKYETGTKEIGAGDIIVFYTDGISEAMNRHREEFSEKRLKQVIEKNSSETAKCLLEAIIGTVQSFVDGELQSDDITIITLKRI